MNETTRIQELIDLFQVLNPNEKITSQFMVRGTSLETLGRTGSGGYQRVVTWARTKVAEKRDFRPALPSVEQELKPIYKYCYDLMKGRNDKYGNSWKVLTIQSTANLIEMKMHRIANMDTQSLDPKVVDELIDSINYGIMALAKLKERGINYNQNDQS